MSDKYDALADRFTEREYGDPDLYFSRRARIVRDLGRPLRRGDLVVDLACADGSFAPAIVALGLRYHGIDLSQQMVEVAKARWGDRASFEVGDMLTTTPPEPAAATVCFRSMHFVEDRPAFFRHAAAFTHAKIVFDADPRRQPLDRIQSELADAGFGRMDVHPFFVPQHRALPRAVAGALEAAEKSPRLARLVLRRRFNVVVAGWILAE